MRRAWMVLAAVIVLSTAWAQGLSALALAQRMRETERSKGFEARLQATTSAPRTAPTMVRLAVVGEFTDQQSRLAFRGIAPQGVLDMRVVAWRAPSGRVEVLGDGSDVAETTETALRATLFGTDLALWDFFTPWWDWPSQEIVGRDRVSDRSCEVLLSRPSLPTGWVREVASCVDDTQGVAMRVEVFGPAHRLLRTITVTRLMRLQSGGSTARAFTVTKPDGSWTRVEVYAGDDRYSLRPDSFAP